MSCTRLYFYQYSPGTAQNKLLSVVIPDDNKLSFPYLPLVKLVHKVLIQLLSFKPFFSMIHFAFYYCF